MSEVILSVAGTAQDGGLPQANCFCENCKRALADAKFKRTAASLAIILPEENKWHLIEATPDLREQMARLQMRYGMEFQLMSSIFLSHAHIGHYPGLMFLGKEAVNSRQIPVIAGAKMKKLLENDAPWSQLTALENIVVQEIKDGQSVSVSAEVTVTPVLVPHRNEFSEAFAFWIIGPNKKVLFIPDIDRWNAWEVDIREAAKDADICFLDGTFYSQKEIANIGRDFQQIPHPLITETMELLQDLVEETNIYFTHLNHSNPVLHKDGLLRKQIEAKGFFIADEEMEFRI
ncbi:MBL fold metallo-hydrolase [Cytobacillus praedii]|uniref:Pyrroloquinoline quinone biosynthesis protein PqqB n=1 Tax=Cytobacillus praedii TaxID=1742358 RepID=A0A4R1B456_9BACI|nr:MBL fold metallo-hydrolase [Cytobacillus praedii]MED3550937.1 MBL fold metallo-hydrolase [Cytobacillus praedii]TCJ05822.1 pyrroloquinoline quinone biosynthesis protein PqqB [Cytobacillus praedii]